jgi:transposase
MSKGVSDKITYKPYEQGQAYLIPPSVDELIPAKHLVRLVSEVIDEMGIERLLRKYQVWGGASRYHPEMMIKLFVYGYMTKVCSSRMLAKGNRVIKRNERWLRLKQKARKALEKHEELRKQRSVEVETVFGQLKGNQGYRRFLLRGTAKVSTEWGLLTLGYNLKQMYRINNQKPA